MYMCNGHPSVQYGGWVKNVPILNTDVSEMKYIHTWKFDIWKCGILKEGVEL